LYHKKILKISTPGRICLFGEHQDYLNLPIIASAISKRIFIEGSKRNDLEIRIDLPDIFEKDSFTLGKYLSYKKERDYFRSSVNVLLKEEFTFSRGFDCLVHGDIPINAGTSSSSALVVTWINFLARMSDQEKILLPEKIADLANRAEVLEFSEPGGMMDHYTTSIGKIICLSSYPRIQIKKVDAQLGTFVLGNSGELKETKNILARVKNGVLQIIKELKNKYPDFSLQTVSIGELNNYKNDLSDEQFELLTGTIENRNITLEAEKVLQTTPLDHKKIGGLLNRHQKILREVLKISTSKIDEMIDAALEAGAYGAKINGSGGGGCMFAYAPENAEKILEAVNRIGKEAFIVHTDEGTREEIFEETEK